MNPAPRPASRRSSVGAARPAKETAASTAKSSAKIVSSVRKTAGEKGRADKGKIETESGEKSARRPGSARVATAEKKRPIVVYAIAGLAVLGIIAGVSYRPVMRLVKLGALDKATDANAVSVADDYVRFEANDEAVICDAVRAKHGPFAAQVRMASAVQSFALLMGLADRSDLTVEQRTTALTAGALIFNADRHHGVELPSDLPTWAEKSDERPLALAAMAVAVVYGAANPDQKMPALLARIAAKPEQDPQRVAAALDGLAKIVTEDSIGQAIALLQGPASEQVIAHAALTGRIHTLTRAPNLAALIGLLDHPRASVRALALETLGGVSLSANADPKTRTELGQRISAKLIPATPAVELAAALKATAGLRLTGARDAVFALLPPRNQLGLPGIDDAWWSECLGRALVLTQPDAARPVSEEHIAKLTATLAVPGSRTVVAKALSLITDANFVNLRPALDKLAEYGETPECLTALTTLVTKTYIRADVAKVCGNDLVKWRAFLAKDRPRSLRAVEIRTYVDGHQDMQRVTVGLEKLTATRDYLDIAGKDLQGWCDEKGFVPPLGLTTTAVESLLHDVKLLHFGVTKAMPATK